MDNKNKTLALACLLAAIILGAASSAMTAKFFYSFDSTAFAYVLVLVGLSLDFGKFVFPAVAGFHLQRERYIYSIVYGFLAIVCIFISFAASMSYDFNAAAQIYNSKEESIVNLDDYKRQQQLFNTNTQAIEDLKKTISDMRASREQDEKKIRNDYEPRIQNAKANKLITTKGGINDLLAQREQAIKALDDSIKGKEAEIASKEAALADTQKGFSGIGKDIKISRGVYQLAAWIDPKDPDGAMGIINLWKNILVEIVAVAFAMAFGALVGTSNQLGIKESVKGIFKRKDESSTLPQQTPQIKGNDSGIAYARTMSPHDFEEAKKPNQYTLGVSQSIGNIPETEKDNNPLPTKNPIGFHSQTSKIAPVSFNNDELLKYINIMYETAIGSVCKGAKTIGSMVDIDPEPSRKIKAFLEQLRIIETRGTQTFILIEKDAALDRLRMARTL